MNLNHLSLSVPDVAETKAFFEKHFGFHAIADKGAHVAVLGGDKDFVLVLTRLREAQHPAYPEDFHIGFMLGSLEEVQAVYDKLRADGLASEQPPKKIRDTISFYFIAPGNFMVEVGCPAA